MRGLCPSPLGVGGGATGVYPYSHPNRRIPSPISTTSSQEPHRRHRRPGPTGGLHRNACRAHLFSRSLLCNGRIRIANRHLYLPTPPRPATTLPHLTLSLPPTPCGWTGCQTDTSLWTTMTRLRLSGRVLSLTGQTAAHGPRSDACLARSASIYRPAA